MAWIKFEKDLLTDPRVLRIARVLRKRHCLLDLDEQGAMSCNGHALPEVTLVCGGLVRIWCLADTHVDVNDVLPLGFDDLNRLIGIPGFCELLPLEWVEAIDADSVKLPNYHSHNGTEAKRKAVTQKRVAAFRSRNARALPDLDLDLDLDQKKKSRGNSARKGSRLPADWLPSESLEAWAIRERQDLDINTTVAKFKDFFLAAPGSKGVKLDWDATFRNWVRAERPGNRSAPPDYSSVIANLKD